MDPKLTKIAIYVAAAVAILLLIVVVTAVAVTAPELHRFGSDVKWAK